MPETNQISPSSGPSHQTNVRYFRAVAVDFDGTLTVGGRPEVFVLDGLRNARARGLRLLLVSGRILEELKAVFPDAESFFDIIVVENGAVLVAAGGVRDLADPVDGRLVGRLGERGVGARQGRVLVAAAGRDEQAVLEEVRRLGLECQLIRNRSEVMVLPSGVSKGSGLSEALGELGLSRHNTIAVGDAENDHSLLAAAELGVAVANAVPSLKEHADIVLDRPNGAGVVSLLASEIVAGRTKALHRRWRVALGEDEAGELIELPASLVNVLIAGGSGDGKSYIAGLLTEQLVGLGYSVLVIDPEGDHVGLADLRGVIVVGGNRHLPPPEAVVTLLEHRYGSVVVDLSSLGAEAQARYLQDLPVEIEAHRRTCGLPQWVVIDEAHRAFARHDTALSVFDPAVKGHCLVTYYPARLSADALAAIDAIVALTNPQPDEAVVDIAAAVGDLPRTSVASLLCRPVGQAVVIERWRPGVVHTVRLGSRRTPHFRHEHKYAMNGIDVARRFYFRADVDRPTGTTAANPVELEHELGHCDPAVVRHHCSRHDFSRWIEGVFHDSVLADAVYRIESGVAMNSPAALVEAARLSLVATLRERSAR